MTVKQAIARSFILLTIISVIGLIVWGVPVMALVILFMAALLWSIKNA